MEVFKNTIKQIVEGTKQYVIPLFQREYVWEHNNWVTLWTNIIDLCEDNEASNHFMGAIVTMPTQSVPHGISKFTLIDGQQRLTTIFILLIALRNKAKQINKSELSEEVNNTLIVNQYKKKSEYFKILPTDKEDDKKAFQELVKPSIEENFITNTNTIRNSHKIKKAYNFFMEQIEEKLQNRDMDIDAILKVVIDRLDIVSIVLSEVENAYFVFESLNATGVKLLPSDLIRNYFMMRVHTDEQADIYNEYWKPLEQTLTLYLKDSTNKEPVDKLPEFIRYYLSLKTNAFISDRLIYSTIKKQEIEKNDTKAYLNDLLTFSRYYEKMFNPVKESNPLIRKYFERLMILNISTVYTFILKCYDDYQRKILSEIEFINVLKIIENFLIRRYVCGIESRDLNKTFPSLYNTVTNYPNNQSMQAGLFTEEIFNDLSTNSFVDNLKSILKEKSRKYPKDDDVRESLSKLEIYGAGLKQQRVKLILIAMEEHLLGKSKENIDFSTLTVEHIMPQSIEKSEHWKKELGKNWENTHYEHLHVIGNLTLSGYNSELGNKPFRDKKTIYMGSKLELNKYFEDKSTWHAINIGERTKYMCELFLKIWKQF